MSRRAGWIRGCELKFGRVIRQLGEMGKTVMVSSHILPELADMCNKIGIIETGESLGMRAWRI